MEILKIKKYQIIRLKKYEQFELVSASIGKYLLLISKIVFSCVSRSLANRKSPIEHMFKKPNRLNYIGIETSLKARDIYDIQISLHLGVGTISVNGISYIQVA
jgi:hypothetical protein